MAKAQPAPHHYIAEEDLFYGGQAGLPVRAHAAGDRVPAEHVERHGWNNLVRHPDPEPEQPPEPKIPRPAPRAGSKEE